MLALKNLGGVETVIAQGLHAFHLGEDEMIGLSADVSDIIARLVSDVTTANG